MASRRDLNRISQPLDIVLKNIPNQLDQLGRFIGGFLDGANGSQHGGWHYNYHFYFIPPPLLLSLIRLVRH